MTGPKLGLSVLMPQLAEMPEQRHHPHAGLADDATQRTGVIFPLNAFSIVEQGRNQTYGGV